MEISERIDKGIYKCIENNCIEPTIIIMHPDSAIQLIEEVIFTPNINNLSDISINNYKYRGIRILRSEDLDINEIIVK